MRSVVVAATLLSFAVIGSASAQAPCRNVQRRTRWRACARRGRRAGCHRRSYVRPRAGPRAVHHGTALYGAQRRAHWPGKRDPGVACRRPE